MAAALSGALLTIPSPGYAQSIVNTARATWVQGGEARSAESNRVETTVEPLPVTIDLMHPTLGASTATFKAPTCGGASLKLVPGQAGNSLSLPASPTPNVRVGELLIMDISAPLANRDAAAIDQVNLTITTESGDVESITVFETAVDSGRFRGAIRTAAIPPRPASGDCRLSVHAGDMIVVSVNGAEAATAIASKAVGVMADPFGLVFDSADGAPVSGARVTLINAASGQEAQVFAEDGVTPWPSSVVSGSPVTDGAGNVYPMAEGEYRFPLTAFGRYSLRITPPSPYTAPSTATREALAQLTRPDGGQFQIVDASFGSGFNLLTPDAVRVDIPVDRKSAGVTLTKTASRTRAQPGDIVLFTLAIDNADPSRPQGTVAIDDLPSRWLRLRPDSLRIDGAGAPGALTASKDGARFSINPGIIPAGGTVRVTYAMTVRADTPAGQIVNRAEATDTSGNRAVAEASLMVEDDVIASRMTVLGRIEIGDCHTSAPRPGIAGVRVMLEDGSFAITDREGRYHFEGVMPGTHVVAIALATMPEGAKPVDCENSTRSAGSAISRFVTGRGGSLVVANFRAVHPDYVPPQDTTGRTQTGEPASSLPIQSLVLGPKYALSDRAAAGADTDWLAQGDGPDEFLFPAMDYNPRIPSIRAVIRHRNGHKIALSINGKPVDALTFEGTRGGPGGSWAVSVWRGIPLSENGNVLKATITDANGAVIKDLTRKVDFVSAPWRAEIVPDRSTMIADGKTRPVVAVRFTDRKGGPVRSGVTGGFTVSEPYQSAAMLDQLQLGQLTGGGSAGATWTIEGDDGIALLELAPTMVSGPLGLQFAFQDEDVTRRQQLDGWVVPGDLDWTLVGLAEGSVGAKTIADAMERTGRFDSDLGDEARIAFYAKGRVLGKALMTLAYDSAKEKSAQRLTGAIDPKAYYTIYSDASTRRFDAASTEKLYVRIETASFYALYGDFVTGFDQTVLARYQRSLTGAKGEARIGRLHGQAFAAKVAGRHRRDEIQGAGISGPYSLSDRNILANSEIVAIEVRDRLRSEIIVSRRELTRFIDYDIDLFSGTITFREPVLSRDFDLNPQFITIDYETQDGFGESEWNAGARADVTLGSRENVRIGLTAISDQGDGARTDVGGVDVRARLGDSTEIRAEAAISNAEDHTAQSWLVEAEHHSGPIDLLAYAREADADFGTGQINGVELGRRKFGADGRYAFSDRASIVARSWFDESTADASNRYAAEADFVYRRASGEGRIGIAHITDNLADGSSATSTVLTGQATQRLLSNRLELGVGTSIALGSTASVDLPTRHTLRARYALTNDIRLVGVYEEARGEKIESSNYTFGFEVAPWQGSRIVSTLGKQDIAEAGSRSYAAFGLSQSLALTQRLTIDATLDGNRKLGGANLADLNNPRHPAANGGQLTEGSLFEDFTAVTLGVGWRVDAWSAVVRGELRNGEFADRRGVTLGVIRQITDGVTVGTGASWTRATGDLSATTEVSQATVAMAYRPADSEFQALGKLEYRGDRVSEAVSGQLAPVGRTALDVDGTASAERLIASLSTNWRPRGMDDGQEVDKAEIGVFLGARYNLDSYQGQELASTSLLGGADLRIRVGSKVEIGGGGTLRAGLTDGDTSFAFGPQVGFVPAKNTLVTLGYNVRGFRDADFSAARHTNDGIYAALKIKFDSDSLGLLGLNR